MLLATSTYLNVASLKSGPRLLTVASVQKEEVGRERKVKDVMRFKETPQGLILSPAINATLSDALGTDDSDKMIGRSVELFVDPTIKMGQGASAITVGGVRARKAKA